MKQKSINRKRPYRRASFADRAKATRALLGAFTKRPGIGASKAYCLWPGSKWGDPVSLYEELRGRATECLDDNPDVILGSILGPGLALAAEEHLSRFLGKDLHMRLEAHMQVPERDFVRATYDAVSDCNVIVECKRSSSWSSWEHDSKGVQAPYRKFLDGEYRPGTIPREYWCQLQHQLLVLREARGVRYIPHAYLAAEVRGEVRIYQVASDSRWQDQHLKRCEKLWAMVQSSTKPTLEDFGPTEKWERLVLPANPIDGSGEIKAAAKEVLELAGLQKANAEKLKGLKAQALAEMARLAIVSAQKQAAELRSKDLKEAAKGLDLTEGEKARLKALALEMKEAEAEKKALVAEKANKEQDILLFMKRCQSSVVLLDHGLKAILKEKQGQTFDKRAFGLKYPGLLKKYTKAKAPAMELKIIGG